MATEEKPRDPQRAIIDPHLHLWDIPRMPGAPQLPQRFLLPDLLETVGRSGHKITHTVFVECHAMYRRDGPAELRPIGETEFANGVAAMSASGGYGPCRVAHRIVGSAHLLLGAAVAPVLEAHQAAAGERFRGVRFPTGFSEAGMFGMPCDPAARHVMLDPRFRAGARVLAQKDLSLDVWCLHTQLAELIDLADALPELTIILDHIGTPETLGAYAGREAEARAEWRAKITDLARRPNVFIKLGGLGMDISGPIAGLTGSTPSGILAAKWRPYIETCIEAFTPQRSMFESNFPPDGASGTYGATWNAFEIIAQGCSEEEQDLLFRRTAAAVYRIALDQGQQPHRSRGERLRGRPGALPLPWVTGPGQAGASPPSSRVATVRGTRRPCLDGHRSPTASPRGTDFPVLACRHPYPCGAAERPRSARRTVELRSSPPPSSRR